MRPPTLLIAASLLSVLAIAPVSNAAICQNAQGCEFWDNKYHEYILNDVDTPVFDVIIVPSASPWALRDVATIELSMQMWEAGVRAQAAPWLADAFEINYYTVGYDVIPAEALADPEVVVIGAEANPFVLFGIGLAVPISYCGGFNPVSGLGLSAQLDPEEWHTHEGSQWSVQSNACASGGHQCIALNTNFFHLNGPIVTIHGAYGERRMHDLVSHEFGHCLGIGHVGDALDFDAKTVPLQDIMSYQYTPSQVHCVSTLNVRSLEGVMGKTMGQPSGIWLDGGDYYHMDTGDYGQVSCANPNAGLVNLPPHGPHP